MTARPEADGRACGAERAAARRRLLGALFAPETIALVDGEGALTAPLTENLQGFAGRVIRVGTAGGVGDAAAPARGELPPGVDLALLASPSALVPERLAACGRAGVKVAVILGAANIEAEVVRRATAGTGLRVLGPGSGGVLAPHLGVNAQTGRGTVRAGSVAFLSQSAALAAAVLEWSERDAVGLSALASVGVAADIGWGELIASLGADPRTRSILIHMDAIGDVRAFLSAAREVAFTKPVIVVKARRAGCASRAAGAGDGPPADPDAVLDAAFRRVGVLRVETLAELFDMAEVLGKQPGPRGPRLAVVANAAGPAALAVDRLMAGGGQRATLAEETRTTLAAAGWSAAGAGEMAERSAGAAARRRAAALRAVVQDSGADGVLAIHAPVPGDDAVAWAHALVEAVADGGKPVLACGLGAASLTAAHGVLAAGGIPVFATPERAAQAFVYQWRFAADLAALYETPRLADGGEPGLAATSVEAMLKAARRTKRGRLTAREAKDLLAAVGLEVETAAVRGAERAVELSLGSRIDPEFGPVIVLGGSGAWAGWGGAAGIGLPPLTTTLARQLLERTRVRRALGPERGFPAATVGALEALLVRFSQLVAERRAIAAIEIDPLRVTPQRIVAGGVRVTLHASAAAEAAAPPLAIRPYPQHYAARRRLADGTTVWLRPIRPEDEPMMVEFHRTLSDQSVYFRYFAPLTLEERTRHTRLARLCFVDYDREIALVAVHTRVRPEIVGVGRLCKAHGRSEAEFAVIVADPWQGRGLGTGLLGRLVEVARAEGIGRLTGTVLRDNHGMRAVAARLGFAERSLRDDTELQLGRTL
jgi:acetyltransferase